ncbi:hypothetical protein G6F35_016398 [Rhizopus arrhizus]|nr:hypothetical protein G6F35_016398 [Rhizopus arrhizus]
MASAVFLAIRAEAAERVGTAGTALVDQEHVALLAHLAQRAVDDDRHFAGGLPGATGQEEHRIRLAGSAAARFQPGDAQVDLAAAGVGAVLRHLQGRALGFDIGAGTFGGQRAGLEIDGAEAAAWGVAGALGVG